jgi:hypothetical protein
MSLRVNLTQKHRDLSPAHESQEGAPGDAAPHSPVYSFTYGRANPSRASSGFSALAVPVYFCHGAF